MTSNDKSTAKVNPSSSGTSKDPMIGMNMLKNSIELGNVGQFATKPSRVPVPSGRRPSQSSSRQRSKGAYKYRPSANGSTANLLEPASRPANYPDGVGRSHPTQTSSDFVVYQTRRQHRKASLNRGGMDIDEQRAHSLTPSSVASQAVSKYPLSAHMHLRSYERLPSARSRSPYPFVTGPRVPKYRPVSPLYSDSQASCSRPPYGVSRGHRYRSPSPLSIYSRERTPPDWQGINLWDSQQGSRPTALDGHSPMNPTSLRMHESKNHTHLRNLDAYTPDPSRFLPGCWPADDWVPTPPPLFYDYSEAFQEQTYFRSFRAVPPTISQTSFQQYGSRNHADLYYELSGEQTQSVPVELSAETNSPRARLERGSSISKCSGPSNDSAPSRTAGIGPVQDLVSPSTYLAGLDSPKESLGDSLLTEKAEEPLVMGIPQSLEKTSTTGHQILTSYKRSQELMRRSGLVYPSKPLERLEPNKGSTPSSSASMYSFETPLKSSEPIEKSSERLDGIKADNPSLPKSDSLSESPSNGESNTKCSELPTIKPPQVIAAPIIHAPIPERSISSPGQKQRFSQILSIEEHPGSHDLPAAPTKIQAHQGTVFLLQKDEMAPSQMLGYTPTPTPRSSSVQQTATFRPDSGISLHHRASPNHVHPGPNELEVSQTPRVDENGTKHRIMKDLPSLPQTCSTTSLTPSLYVDPSAIREGSVKSLALGHARGLLKQASAVILAAKEMEKLPPVPPVPPLKFKVKLMKNRDSVSSLTHNRPWNLEENYSWTNDQQKLHITMPDGSQEEPKDVKRLSKFKLRTLKPSTTDSDTVKINKNRPNSTPIRRFSGANDLFRAPIRRHSKLPGGKRTKIKRTSVHTRFIETFDSTLPSAPALSLVPPSPDLNIEMKDFYEDKSLQVRPKSGLRERLSNLKHKAAGADHSENGQSAHQHGSSPLLTKNIRTSKRSSVTSVRSFDGESRLKGVRTRFMKKIKGWLLKGEDRIQAWRAKRRARRAESLHSRST